MRLVSIVKRTFCCGFVVALAAGCSQQGEVTTGPDARVKQQELAVVQGGPGQGKRDPRLEAIALFDGKAMPTGVTVSKSGRIFLSFPRWADPVASTVVELRDGKTVPYPDSETNQFDSAQPQAHDPKTHLVSVQSVVVDASDTLWILDPGSINLGPVIDNAPKLWAYDLSTNHRVKEITFPADVVMPRTYLNDVRIDLHRGPSGTAYITDSGLGGIIVIDLASGKSWRHLEGHPSVLPDPSLTQMSEGQPLLQRHASGYVEKPSFHSDGIALSPDGKTLYYNAIASHDIWSVPTDLLANPNADESKIVAAVKKVASKPSGNDGLICNSKGRIYSADFEDNAIRVIDPGTGNITLIVQDERLIWPDTMSMQGDELYVTSNQLARQPNYHFGKDLRTPPYALFRIAVAAEANPR